MDSEIVVDINFNLCISLFIFMGYCGNVYSSTVGYFYESKVFDDCDSYKAEEYGKKFPYMEKLKLPRQWA